MSGLLQIRNVPEETRRTLKARAAERGVSLNRLMLEVLEREAARPTVAEVLARAAHRAGNTTVSSAELIREMREERDQELLRRVTQ